MSKCCFCYCKLVLDYALMTNGTTLNALIAVKLKQKLACCCLYLLKIGITSFVIGVWRQINSYLSIAVYFLLVLVSTVNTSHRLCAPTLLNCSLVELPRDRGNRSDFTV